MRRRSSRCVTEHRHGDIGWHQRRARDHDAVPRLRRPGQQPPDTQRLACVGLVRHRRPQHEGGLPGRVRSDRHLRQLRRRTGCSTGSASPRPGQIVPNQITQRITPWQQANRTRYDAFYVQDQWTLNRLTLQGALRYEHAWSFFPEGMNGLLADSVLRRPGLHAAVGEGRRPATTTSRRAWAWPTTCSATAGRRSR